MKKKLLVNSKLAKYGPSVKTKGCIAYLVKNILLLTIAKSYIVIPVDLNLIDHGTFTGIIESPQQNDATFQI
jgi:hypothetical protein